MESLLSLAEITAAITDPSVGDAQSIMRRIRHWTLAGALATVGGTHTGTGKHRRYPVDAAYLAVVLCYLADWGLSIGVLKGVAETLLLVLSEGSMEDIDLWGVAKQGKTKVYLTLITISNEKMAGPFIFELRSEEKMAEWARHARQGMFLNLTEIFRSVKL